MGKRTKDSWLGDALDENDIEEVKRANSLLQLSLDNAKMRGYDRIDSGHWAIAHAGYYSAMQMEMMNKILIELTSVVSELQGSTQNIASNLAKIAFTMPDGQPDDQTKG